MPYQPTNPYPYNTGIDLDEGLTFQFKVDNYDIINKFKIEIYDLFREERIYTIVREIGELEKNEIIEGENQIISIYDKNNNLIYIGYYEGKSALPVEGGWNEESVCKLEMSRYLMTLEQIKKKRYYSNVEDINNLIITENSDGESFYILDEQDYIIGVKEGYEEAFQTAIYNNNNILVIPYEVDGKIVQGIGAIFNTDEEVKACFTASFEEIVIPNSVYAIRNNAFSGNESLTKVIFNYGITEIGDSVFEGCTALTEIKLLDSVITIGISCFENCISLTKINLSASIRTIPEKCFYNNVDLNNINLDNILHINKQAFEGCVALIDLNSIKQIQFIGEKAFFNCSSIYQIVLPDSLSTIEIGAFGGCVSLISLTIPFVGKNRTSTAMESLFGYIFGTEDIPNIEKTIQYYNILDSGIFESQSYTIPSNLVEVVITDTTQLNFGVFSNCSKIMNITLNEGLVKIEDYCFYNCSYLKKIEIPSTVTYIGINSFAIEKEGGE